MALLSADIPSGTLGGVGVGLGLEVETWASANRGVKKNQIESNTIGRSKYFPLTICFISADSF